ncbi:MAG: hypothetical protein M1272_03635, partial [Firmicutes bacterium]|nr:hypothetical protein [Bacillota bacterium]
MDILEATFFPGPNRHVLRPCFEARVRLGHYGQEPTSAHYAFQDRLIAALPGLDEHFVQLPHFESVRRHRTRESYWFVVLGYLLSPAPEVCCLSCANAFAGV